MAEHGYDIAGILDLSTDLRVIHGREALLHAIARRLTTPRGALFYDPSYGHDVRQYVNAPAQRAGLIESQVSLECLKDERVLDAEVDVETTDEFGEGLILRLTITDSLGPFRFTLQASALTVELLREIS